MAEAKKDKKPPSGLPEPLACIAKLPGDDREAADAVCAELMAGGAERIAQLIGAVGEFGANEGVQPRYAVHALTVQCCRKGAEKERALFAATLAKELGEKHSPSVKAFLVRQLQFAGTPAEVAALAKLIGDGRLGLPAVSALTAMGGKEATAALRAALPASKGRTRVGIVQSLGRFGDAESVPALIAAAADKDADTRLNALDALAAIGKPEAIDTLKKAAAAEPVYERDQALAACLTLAENLGANGEGEKATALCQHLLDTCKVPHIQRAAANGLKLQKGASK